MSRTEWVEERVFDRRNHWNHFEFVALRVAYVLKEPGFVDPKGGTDAGDDGVTFRRHLSLAGMPVRNSINRLEVDWDDAPLAFLLRTTDAFGEILLELRPTEGQATAYLNVINRVLQGGFSHSSPQPEETEITPLGRFTFDPIPAGRHRLTLRALEDRITLAIDDREVLEFTDPDVGAGRFGFGSAGRAVVSHYEQTELISPSEHLAREEFVERMAAFGRELDREYASDVAARNAVAVNGNTLTWTYPETRARLQVTAGAGALTADFHAGLYGDARMFHGAFALPDIAGDDGERYAIAPGSVPRLSGGDDRFTVALALRSSGGRDAALTLTFELTELPVWFCTAEIEGATVSRARLAFGLDPAFAPNGEAAQDAKEIRRTDYRVGYCVQRISGQDTALALETGGPAPLLTLTSGQNRFRWAFQWYPAQKLNLTGYKKRMVHFIRYPQTPVQEWRERPSKDEYPTDEELLRYAAQGTTAMTWHHTWTSNNYRRRDGFIVNATEMSRAMKTAHDLGIAVITYIGVVPVRHPVLRYADLCEDPQKNWDLQDFGGYSIAGRWYDFLPWMTDVWCREYGLDGYYADGGLGGMSWGNTGLSEADRDGLSLEELWIRFYSRVRRVLRRHRAGFGLERWGGTWTGLVAGFYDVCMIGETYQEYAPEAYRDVYNPLLTGTPFKMYAMDLTARNRYNIAMAGVCLTDLKMCSGNHAWGNWPDRPSDWKNLRPFWAILDSIDWDDLLDARPWWAQTLLRGEGFYAGHYTTSRRCVFFLANHEEEPREVTVELNVEDLPAALKQYRLRPLYPDPGDPLPIQRDRLTVRLPRLHDGPLGFEMLPRE